MSRIAQRILFALPAAYAASLFVSAGAFAAPVATTKAVDSQVAATKPVDSQVTATTAKLGALDIPEAAATPITTNEPLVAKSEPLSPDATEIKPSDWQYGALQNLVSKYDCGSNALGGQAVSRDSFVDGLNSCLKKVEPIMAKNPSQVSAEELDSLRRLTQEFRAELSNIDTRIEKVQQRTALAQSSQFSTTTKLKGEVIVGFNSVISGAGPGSNATVGNRARLLLESTFTGKDRLYTRLAAANAGGYGNFQGNVNGVKFTNPSGSEANQTYFGGINGKADNSVNLDWLAYQFPLGNTNIYAAAYNGIHSDYADTHSPYFQDFTGGSGAISLLAEENPIYKVGGGTGVGVTIPLNNGTSGIGLDSINLSYFAGTTANSPANGNGIFAGRNSYLAQVNFKPSDKFDFGLTYVNAYHNGGAIYDFGSGGAVVGTPFTAGALGGYSTSNSYGLSASYKASDNFNLNGYITKTSALSVANANVDILTYGVGAAFPNIGQPGNLLGFFVGQAPTVTNNAGLASSAYHLEGFYKYKLSDNVSITPGLIYLTNPNQVKDNGTGALVGTVRTTFTF
jgi:Carbohydrate-selective porin, OprB family